MNGSLFSIGVFSTTLGAINTFYNEPIQPFPLLLCGLALAAVSFIIPDSQDIRREPNHTHAGR